MGGWITCSSMGDESNVLPLVEGWITFSSLEGRLDSMFSHGWEAGSHFFPGLGAGSHFFPGLEAGSHAVPLVGGLITCSPPAMETGAFMKIKSAVLDAEQLRHVCSIKTSQMRW